MPLHRLCRQCAPLKRWNGKQGLAGEVELLEGKVVFNIMGSAALRIAVAFVAIGSLCCCQQYVARSILCSRKTPFRNVWPSIRVCVQFARADYFALLLTEYGKASIV